MPRIRTVALICIVFSSFCGTLYGLGMDHPRDKPIRLWPTQLRPGKMNDQVNHLLNQEGLVHGFLVNWADVLFYAGDTKLFNRFVKEFSEIEGLEHVVVLHVGGRGKARSPWDKKGQGVDFDWKLVSTVKSGGGKVGKYVTEIHLLVDGQVRLKKLNIPLNVKV